MRQIKEGFEGQQLMVLPKPIVSGLRQHPLLAPLHFTHVGHYPKAQHHFVDRADGAGEVVLIYCTAGRGWYQWETERYSVAGGHFFVLPPKGHHQYGAAEGGYWALYFLHFSGHIAAYLFGRLQQQCKNGGAAIPFSSRRIRYFEEMLQLLTVGYGLPNLEKANALLWPLLQTFLAPDWDLQHEGAQSPVNRSIAFFQERIGQRVTLQEAASHVGLSVSHFSGMFRQATGHAPMDYFQQLKVQRACQYLDFTDLTVKAISYELGISDPYYFSRFFKKVMGESPRAYRKRQK